MKFDFSDDLKLLREQGWKFLQEHSPPKAVNCVLESEKPFKFTFLFLPFINGKIVRNKKIRG
jgi:hypothetical protein